MDTEKKNSFQVFQYGNLLFEFPCNKRGLYTMQPNKKYLSEIARVKKLAPATKECLTEVSENKECLVETLKDRMEGLSKRRITGAYQARYLYQALGHPKPRNSLLFYVNIKSRIVTLPSKMPRTLNGCLARILRMCADE